MNQADYVDLATILEHKIAQPLAELTGAVAALRSPAVRSDKDLRRALYDSEDVVQLLTEENAKLTARLETIGMLAHQYQFGAPNMGPHTALQQIEKIAKGEA